MFLVMSTKSSVYLTEKLVLQMLKSSFRAYSKRPSVVPTLLTPNRSVSLLARSALLSVRMYTSSIMTAD